MFEGQKMATVFTVQEQPAELADHRCYILRFRQKQFADHRCYSGLGRKKGSHILHRPDHLVDCWPPPRTHYTPCLLRCPLVPVLLRHGGHSAALVARMSYTRLLVLSSINSLTGSVLKNRSTTTSIGTSLP